MSEPLTLAEAVPLGTVHLQRLLVAAGIRSLVIKGPAFVELGVRKPRQSNDIDLLVAPEDRTGATEALADAGWSIISHWFPPALDDVIYSTTFRHPLFPVTLDLHHHFSGLLADDAFEHLWQRCGEVSIAHLSITAPSVGDALIIEGLNAVKRLAPGARAGAAQRVAAAAGAVDLEGIVLCAESLGARHTARDLIEQVGGSEPTSPPPDNYRRWARHGARVTSLSLIFIILRRSPQHAPRVAWEQLTLDPATARFWAHTHQVTYRSPRQILRVRVRRMFRSGQ